MKVILKPSYIYRFFAKCNQSTVLAFWVSCRADISAEMDNAVTKIVGFLRVENALKLHFHLDGIGGVAKSKTVADSNKMGVGHNGGFSVNISHN